MEKILEEVGMHMEQDSRLCHREVTMQGICETYSDHAEHEELEKFRNTTVVESHRRLAVDQCTIVVKGLTMRAKPKFNEWQHAYRTDIHFQLITNMKIEVGQFKLDELCSVVGHCSEGNR